MIFPCTDENVQAVRESYTVLLQEEVIIFSWCSRGLSLIERNLKKWILLMTKCVLQKMFQKIHVVKHPILNTSLIKHYGDLTVLN